MKKSDFFDSLVIKHMYHVYKNSCDIVFQFEQVLFRVFAFFAICDLGSGHDRCQKNWIKSSKYSRFWVVNSNHKCNTLGDERLRSKADHDAPYELGEHDR